MYLSSVQIQQVAVKSVKLNESAVSILWFKKSKGIQQQLIQNFQEIPSTFYELAVNYINHSPINHKNIEIFPGFHITYFPFTGFSFGCRS